MNLAAFLRDFVNSLLWAKDAQKAVDYVPRLLATLAFVGFPVSSFAIPDLRPYAPFIVSIAICYVSWIGGRSWQRTRGPVIRTSQLERDPDYGLFRIRVQNCGAGEVECRVFATESVGTSRITSEIELGWQGYESKRPMVLAGKKTGIVGVLQMEWSTLKNPQLWLCTPGEGRRFRLVPISDDMPHLKQQPIELKVRVEFTKDSVFVCDKTLAYRIKPISGDHPEYVVTRV